MTAALPLSGHDVTPLWLLPALAVSLAATLVVLAHRLFVAVATEVQHLSFDPPGAAGHHLATGVVLVLVLAATLDLTTRPDTPGGT